MHIVRRLVTFTGTVAETHDDSTLRCFSHHLGFAFYKMIKSFFLEDMSKNTKYKHDDFKLLHLVLLYPYSTGSLTYLHRFEVNGSGMSTSFQSNPQLVKKCGYLCNYHVTLDLDSAAAELFLCFEVAFTSFKFFPKTLFHGQLILSVDCDHVH